MRHIIVKATQNMIMNNIVNYKINKAIQTEQRNMNRQNVNKS